MIKQIKIDKDHSVTLNSAAGWFFVYREQFSHDILPDILPAIEGVLSASIKVIQNMDGVNVKDIAGAIDDSILTDFFINLSGFEFTTVLQIFWAMAKTADDDIAPPEIYFSQFDTFPLDTILPKVFKMVLESSVSTKNAKRLSASLKTTAAGFQSIKLQ